MSNEWEQHEKRLLEILAGYGKVAVALSGGVDSAVVAHAAHRAAGDHAVAVTAQSPSLAGAELEQAKAIADFIGIRHVIVDTREFDDPRYVKNDGTRCYFCKSELYERLESLRSRLGFNVICSGANKDDEGDYRPGLKAAAEKGVRHPLQEAGFTKDMVRHLAKQWGLPNWNKPASPCLSSRIAIGVEATPERTARIESAEAFLRGMGLRDFRVRCHPGELARIEVDEADLPRFAAPEVAAKVSQAFKRLGFQFVSVDLEPFRSGRLNVMIPPDVLAMSMSRPPEGN